MRFATQALDIVSKVHVCRIRFIALHTTSIPRWTNPAMTEHLNTYLLYQDLRKGMADARLTPPIRTSCNCPDVLQTTHPEFAPVTTAVGILMAVQLVTSLFGTCCTSAFYTWRLRFALRMTCCFVIAK